MIMMLREMNQVINALSRKVNNDARYKRFRRCLANPPKICIEEKFKKWFNLKECNCSKKKNGLTVCSAGRLVSNAVTLL